MSNNSSANSYELMFYGNTADKDYKYIIYLSAAGDRTNCESWCLRCKVSYNGVDLPIIESGSNYTNFQEKTEMYWCRKIYKDVPKGSSIGGCFPYTIIIGIY